MDQIGMTHDRKAQGDRRHEVEKKPIWEIMQSWVVDGV